MRRFDSAQRAGKVPNVPSRLKPPGRRASRPTDALAKANASRVTNNPTHKAHAHGA